MEKKVYSEPEFEIVEIGNSNRVYFGVSGPLGASVSLPSAKFAKGTLTSGSF